MGGAFTCDRCDVSDPPMVQCHNGEPMHRACFGGGGDDEALGGAISGHIPMVIADEGDLCADRVDKWARLQPKLEKKREPSMWQQFTSNTCCVEKESDFSYSKYCDTAGSQRHMRRRSKMLAEVTGGGEIMLPPSKEGTVGMPMAILLSSSQSVTDQADFFAPSRPSTKIFVDMELLSARSFSKL
eukprot:GEMP01094860.1.p1 GENE.GEMP01094860.1~~GEMP01094860.1.p1  ORF type:complete len:185 (+),score=33.04 GEMP01094860.1:162-716(+)